MKKKKIPFNENDLTDRDYALSRKLFIYEGCTGVGIYVLTTGAFLAGLANYLGAGNTFNGIISAIPILAGIMQALSPYFIEKLPRRKSFVITTLILSRLFFIFMLLIPVLGYSTKVNLILLPVSYFIAYLFAFVSSPAVANWIVDLTPESIRGRYFGIRESYIIAFTAIISLVMGKTLDYFKVIKSEISGFNILAIVVFVLSVVDIIFYVLLKEPTSKPANKKILITDMILKPFKNKTFSFMLILTCIWNVALQISAPFFSVYLVTGLKLDYLYIMIMGLIQSGISVLLVRAWGKMADRRSWAHTSKISIIILAISFAISFVVRGSNYMILVPIIFIINGVAWSGINISLFNLQFKYAPQEARTVFIGINGALGSIIGFASALVGAGMINATDRFDGSNVLFGLQSMQIVFGVSSVLLLVCAGYIHKYMCQHDDSNRSYSNI